MTIRDVKPTDAVIGGPDMIVRINGDAFHGATGVSFGADVEIIRFTIIDDGLIAVVIRVLPAAAAGYRTIEVFRHGGATDQLQNVFLIA